MAKISQIKLGKTGRQEKVSIELDRKGEEQRRRELNERIFALDVIVDVIVDDIVGTK